MMETNRYARFARYYDCLQGRDAEDVGFFLRAAAGVSGPILELGAGSGRLLEPLVLAGHQVVGVELEPAMMALARPRLQEARRAVQAVTAVGGSAAGARLVQGSMVAFTLPERFALALFSHNTFAHLAMEQMAPCIRCVAAHLAAGGMVLIDMSNPFILAAYADTQEPVREESWLEDNPRSDRVLFSQSRHQAQRQRVTIYWHFRSREGSGAGASAASGAGTSAASGAGTREDSFQFDLHYLFPHQWDELLTAAGLRLQALYGDYDYSPFGEQSPRLLLVAGASSPADD